VVPLIQSNLGLTQDLCRRYQVRHLFLFGSALGDRFDPHQSDLDFIVEFHPRERQGFDDVYLQFLEALQRTLGRPVDLIEAHTLRNPYLIASINRTKRMLYAA
jgi:hypothetical protein